MDRIRLKKRFQGCLVLLALLGCERSLVPKETRLRSGRVVKQVSLTREKPDDGPQEVLVFECVWSVKPMAPGVPLLGDLEELSGLIEKEAEKDGFQRIDIVIYGPAYFDPVPAKEALVHRLQRRADGTWGPPGPA